MNQINTPFPSIAPQLQAQAAAQTQSNRYWLAVRTSTNITLQQLQNAATTAK